MVEALKLIDNFRKVSGLELNLQKTQGVILGEIELNRNISKEIKWGNRIKILGIHFDSGNYIHKDQVLNFDPAIVKMKRTCNSWKMRKLSLKGKIVILNTLVLPIIYYQCTMLPVPQKTFKDIDSIITEFLWGGKKLVDFVWKRKP